MQMNLYCVGLQGGLQAGSQYFSLSGADIWKSLDTKVQERTHEMGGICFRKQQKHLQLPKETNYCCMLLATIMMV